MTGLNPVCKVKDVNPHVMGMTDQMFKVNTSFAHRKET